MAGEIEAMLYRAVRELEYIQILACQTVDKKYVDIIASSAGAEIVEEGMKLLGIADLSADDYASAPRIETQGANGLD